jgi:hypothetical protein
MTGKARFALVFAFAFAALAAPGASAADTVRPGKPVAVQPVTGPPPAASSDSGRQSFAPRTIHNRKLRRAKARAAAQAQDAAAPRAVPGSSRATVFGGLNADGLVASGSAPSDSTGAIGPSTYIEMVNSSVALYNRTSLAQTASATYNTFTGLANNLFDPQIQFDPVANRFFYVMDRVVSSTSNFLVFGWSKTATPSTLTTADWCHFQINTSPQFDDYPKLGHDDNHIIIGTNVFADSGSGGFDTARIWSVPKPANGDTSCTTPSSAMPFGSAGSPLLTADGDFAFTPMPANTFASSANGYVVAADFFADAQIMAWHVSGPPASPTLTQDGNMNVNPYAVPANVPQPSSAFLLDASDTRLTQAVGHTDPAAGALAVWTQHTIDGPGGRSQVRWYELLPASLTVRQQGNVANGSHWVFNGAISPTANGAYAAINYNVGSSTQLVQVRGQSRLSADALGTMGGEVTLVTSPGINQDFTCSPPFGPPCRWGDYAGASPDPNNPGRVVWGTSQYNGTPSGTNAVWRTRNFALDVGVDVTAPDTSIAGPNGPPKAPNPSFNISATEPATFQCALDGAAFAACTSPLALSGLANGSHTLQARAVDFAPNPDASPASVTFDVDTVGPTATIDGKKKIKQGKNAKFTLASSEPNSTFQCQLDGKGLRPAGRAFSSCSSPLVIKKPKKGKHTVEVRAIDAVGNVGTTTTKNFKVKKKKKRK